MGLPANSFRTEMRAVRKGFTLVELLVVTVLLGILAAIAIAQFVSAKDNAYMASMKSDFSNLAITNRTTRLKARAATSPATG